jgi:O-succinylbenzoic acid--CoA ligase
MMPPILDLDDLSNDPLVHCGAENSSWRDIVARVRHVGRGVHFIEGANSIDAAVLILAAASGVCSTVPLNPRWTDDECAKVIREFKADHIPPGVFIATSGSQGVPKLVHLSPDALVYHALSVNLHLEISERDTWLACLPFFHVGGMAIVIRSALARAEMVIAPSTEAVTVAELLEHNITVVSLVPTILRRVLELRNDSLPESVRAVILGGGPVPKDLVERCSVVYPTYGLTEAGSMVTCARPGQQHHERTTAGVPISAASIRLVDEAGDVVPRNVTGRILVRSTGASDGYWNSPKETALTFREGWIFTEDYGFVDRYGCLHIQGRKDRIAVTGGENVSLAEVEMMLRTLPNVRDALCCALEDSEWGQIVCALIESDHSLPLDLIREQLRGKISSHKFPRKIVSVARLPLLPNGKPDMLEAKKLFG